MRWFRRMPGRAFLMSTELELQTSLLAGCQPFEMLLDRLYDILSQLAPSVQGPSGLFNGYGRIYFDSGHLELALCECASPCELPSIVERQQEIVRRAVEQLAGDGVLLLLANNNSNGFLHDNPPTWGSHENILTECHPDTFGESILPFLLTRIHGGSGGIDLSDESFVAGVRPLRMQALTGGGTTDQRAIHSTARDEHHMGDHPRQFRYHLILGDGHRSHFNLALQFATTALALKAIFFVPGARQRIAERAEQLKLLLTVPTLHRLNVLERADESWRVDPTVTAMQRLYLELATEYAEQYPDPPAWIPWALTNWSRMLDAFDQRDLDWLSTRFDAFAKYRIYKSIVEGRGLTWANLIYNQELTHELALLDQSYHSFCRSDSLFHRLEQAGLMQHRLQPYVGPGEEPEPFVPEVGTRAEARARMIRQHATNRNSVVMDWSCMYDRETAQLHTLLSPFATEYELGSMSDALP
jgi:hypothetical protein